MRFPVFARHANPRVDLPILRKSQSYVFEQVERGLADWVDQNNPKAGIICRELLYFGERTIPLETVGNQFGKLPPREVPGVYFQLPQSEQWRKDHRTVTFMAESEFGAQCG